MGLELAKRGTKVFQSPESKNNEMIAPDVATATHEPSSGVRTAAAAEPARYPQRWSYEWVWLVVVLGVLVTAAVTVVTARLASSNERHLLDLRSKEVGAAVTSVLPDVQTPLGAAVALADITGDTSTRFRQFAETYAGTGKEFVSLSVWRVGHLNQGPVTVVGAAPELSSARGGATAILRGAAKRSGLTVRGLLHAKQPRIAYAFSGPRPGPFVVEAESAVAPTRYAKLPANSAYSNLNVALYIGKRPTASRLLLKTVQHLPLPGEQAVTAVPFGSDTLTVVISARQPLEGSFPQELPWMIVVLGVLLTAGAGLLTYRLIVGGRRAQALARENRRLYSEQRGIAQSLQHALLPEALPEIEGVQVAGLYAAGDPGIDIGGDWYDLIRLDAQRVLLVVGDVSGRGIRAAAAMASLRFAIHYAAQTDPPEVFLPKLSRTRSLLENGQLATVLCVVIDLQAGRVSVTSAGHLPPLMLHDGRCEFLRPEIGVPIGVDPSFTYSASTFDLPERAVLLGFTDGLVERHGENLDDGLDRLCRVAAGATGDLEDVMRQILEHVRGPESHDDTAMAGMQWANPTS